MLHVYSVTVRCSYYAMQPQKDVGLSIIILRGARNSAPTKFSKIKSFVINSQLCLLAEADRRRASLARRTWACQVQTRHDHATLSERYCSSVYLAVHCVPVSATTSRQHLRSAASHQLVVLSYRLSSYGRQTFSVACLPMWNSLPTHLRDPVHTTSFFAPYSRKFSFPSTSVYGTAH